MYRRRRDRETGPDLGSCRGSSAREKRTARDMPRQSKQEGRGCCAPSCVQLPFLMMPVTRNNERCWIGSRYSERDCMRRCGVSMSFRVCSKEFRPDSPDCCAGLVLGPFFPPLIRSRFFLKLDFAREGESV